VKLPEQLQDFFPGLWLRKPVIGESIYPFSFGCADFGLTCKVINNFGQRILEGNIDDDILAAAQS
jgi:hypothetical protein